MKLIIRHIAYLHFHFFTPMAVNSLSFREFWHENVTGCSLFQGDFICYYLGHSICS